MEQSLLNCNSLNKKYGSKTILQDLSLKLGASIIAVVGSNGVGKSTLFSIFSGADMPDSGDVRINDASLMLHPVAAKMQLSYVPDKATIYPFMTGEEYLRLVHLAKKDHDTAHTQSVVDGFGLTQHLNQRFSRMSLGTQRKFMLSAAFIGNPKVIIMDEPSNGLDQTSRNRLIAMLLQGSDKRLVIFSTHDKYFLTQTGASIMKLEHGKLEFAHEDISDSYFETPSL